MDKQKMLKLLGKALDEDDKVVFAYLYGSFVKGEFFRDIDIGIYVKNPEENPFVISSDLKTLLSRIFKKENFDHTADQFDIQIINRTSFTFLKKKGFQRRDIAG
ncbi:MAG: nucleotidyltransferase domain-containing protein [Thermodesulfobacteriota bacterium]